MKAPDRNPSDNTRRCFLCQGLSLAAWAACTPVSVVRAAAPSVGDPPVAIGSRRELLVDDFLIASLTGAELKPHKPEPRDVAIVCDAPWEGNTSAYYSIFQDGDVYRMYYRGSHSDKAKKMTHAQLTCYAHSSDGVTWTKPSLGLFEFEGSKQNNIVWTGAGTHNFTPFKDPNPACASDARYKALAGGTTTVDGKRKECLNALQSPDGLHWKLLAEGVITAGAFDSQNLAFWDSLRGEYRAYWRIFAGGVRAIRTATSRDFLRWDHQADLTYGDAPAEHLYTNAVLPYFRAPHLFVGFPTRYQPRTQQVEPVFMTSRDGVAFRRWSEELIPITAPQDRDGNRSNYMTWGLLQLPGQEREVSVYATEAYYAGPGSRVRRFTFRTDGFVSAHADGEGTLVTKPLTFSGSRLSLNLASRGTTRVELQDAGGKPLPGFGLDDGTPIVGDQIGQFVAWKGGSLSPLAGQPVRLRFVLRDADLYSFQFTA